MYALLPTREERAPKRVTLGVFDELVVAIATVRSKSDNPRERFEQCGFTGAVFTDEDGDRRWKVYLEVRAEHGERERKHAGLHELFFHADVCQERAAGSCAAIVGIAGRHFGRQVRALRLREVSEDPVTAGLLLPF